MGTVLLKLVQTAAASRCRLRRHCAGMVCLHAASSEFVLRRDKQYYFEMQICRCRFFLTLLQLFVGVLVAFLQQVMSRRSI